LCNGPAWVNVDDATKKDVVDGGIDATLVGG